MVSPLKNGILVEDAEVTWFQLGVGWVWQVPFGEETYGIVNKIWNAGNAEFGIWSVELQKEMTVQHFLYSLWKKFIFWEIRCYAAVVEPNGDSQTEVDDRTAVE